MKELGNTPDGGKIVEFTHNEAAELAKLIAVSKGIDISVPWNFDESLEFITRGVELNGLFGAVRAFRAANYQINVLKHLVEMLDTVVLKSNDGGYAFAGDGVVEMAKNIKKAVNKDDYIDNAAD